MSILILDLMDKVNPVRNSSRALNPAGIILKSNPAAEQRDIISNGVNSELRNRHSVFGMADFFMDDPAIAKSRTKN